MSDCVKNPPTEAGYWNVSITGVMSCAAIYWLYDGTKWHTDSFIDGELKEGDAQWWEGTRRDSICGHSPII